MTQTLQILRSTRIVTLATLLSRIFGYLRDLIIAVLLGTTFAADAFVIALRLPNLLRRLTAEGAMTPAYVPVFTSYRAKQTEAESWEFARRMFWTLATVMAGVTLLGIIFAPALVRLFTLASTEPEQWSLAVQLTRITFPYCMLIALAALAGATLNTLRVFGLPASIPIYLNLAIIIAGGAAWLMGLAEPAVALALGVVIGGALQLLVQIPALVRRGMPFGFKPDFRHPGIRRVVRLLVPAVGGVGIYQVNVLVSTVFASQAEGWISALYYADRVMEVALGVYAISVATVVLPVLSQQAVERNLDAMRKTLTFSLRNVAFIVVPASVGLIVLGDPIIRMLFQHKAFTATSTDLTTRALLFYAIGLPAFAAARLGVQGFYALEDMVTPFRVAGLALVANVALCFALVGPMGHGGLALATSLASYLNVIVLYVVFRRRVGSVEETRLVVSVGRAILASAGMGLVCWWLAQRLNLMHTPQFGLLVGGCLATVAAGVLAYLLFAWLLRAEELSEVYTLVTGRQTKQGFAGVRAPAPYTPNNK